MSASILFELFNLSVGARPTGIATYARNLTQTAQDLGYSIDGLFHTYLTLDRKDEVLTDISFFDARNRAPSKIAKHVELNWRRIVGVPTGFRPVRLPLAGVVIDPHYSGRSFGTYRNAYALRLFMEISRFHFKRYGSCATCHPPVKPTIFHATQAIPIRVPGAANIYTIHDIVPLRLPYTTLDDKKFFLKMVRHLGRTADHIVTVSEASRRDLIEICNIPPHNVTNTYQSVSFPEAVLSASDDEVATHVDRAFDLDYRGYYLFYGALEPKKNVARLVDAHVVSGTPYPLVIAGGLGWEYESDLARIEQYESTHYRIRKDRIQREQRIRRLGHLPLSHLVSLIRGARAVLFPSLYEGFGLPVLEAMLLGTPVLTSNVASLAEIASDAARLVDPFEIADIARGIRDLDQDEGLREELTRRGKLQVKKFSPDEYQKRLADIYRKVDGSGARLPDKVS
ncbi:MAG: glycosyltransferase family 4 protein [Beijerinckiaceae bacterium]